ncbi:MAG TPA: 50S ribosomal protein L17 [Clostridiales bacterium UBA8153]|nr:50S ribosomal protein L17 [Clostridiales bacterium UBA8153]
MGYAKLGRPTSHRLAMLRGLVTALLANESIVTTAVRAKETRSLAEQMITLGKRESLHARRQALAFITDEDVVKKLFDTIGPRYAHRSGGYTRMVKLGNRRGDAAPIVRLELIQG